MLIHPVRFARYYKTYGKGADFASRLRRLVADEWCTPYVERSRQVLEIAAGKGFNLCRWAERCPQTHFVGCEPWEKQLRDLRRNVAERGLTHVEIAPVAFEEFESDPGRFDFVYAINVLAHVADDRAFLEKACALMTPGAHLFLHVSARGVKFYKHEHHARPGYTKTELKALLRQTGFEVERMEYTFGRIGMRFHQSRRPGLSNRTRAIVHCLDRADVRRRVKSSIGVVARKR